MKRINITVSEESQAILDKYKAIGIPAAATIRKAIEAYDQSPQAKEIVELFGIKSEPKPKSWDGVDEQ